MRPMSATGCSSRPSVRAQLNGPPPRCASSSPPPPATRSTSASPPTTMEGVTSLGPLRVRPLLLGRRRRRVLGDRHLIPAVRVLDVVHDGAGHDAHDLVHLVLLRIDLGHALAEPVDVDAVR